MAAPNISVITPVLDGARYIERCIANVIEQNCSAVEHIIIDGGSTDGTVDIIQAYAARHDNIRWITEPDRGQSDAMNKGLHMARGRIVSFLNVDDFYERGVFSRVLEVFADLPEPSLVVANCRVVDAEGREQYINRPRGLTLRELLLPHKNPFPMNPSAYFYHRSLHDLIGYYDLRYHYEMDLDFMLRAVQAVHLVRVDEVWGNFLWAPGTKTYDDYASGCGAQRMHALLRRYRGELALHHRLWLWSELLFYRAISLLRRLKRNR